MTTISQTPNRRNGLIGTILRLVAACALLIIGAYLVMLGAGKLFSYSKPVAQETHTIECRRIQLLIDALWTFVPESWHCPKCGAEFETGVEMMQHYNQCKKK